MIKRFIERFGLANAITIVRILLIPVFLLVLLVDWPGISAFLENQKFLYELRPILAAIIFIFIAATDAVDGYIARTRNEITSFGKLMDPLADKLLVSAALLALVQLNIVPAWVAFVIISREFVVSGLRMVVLAEGVVVAASKLGKLKTVLQVVSVVMLVGLDSAFITQSIGYFAFGYKIVSYSVLGAAVIVTVWSMIDYFTKASEALGPTWEIK